MSQLPPDSKPNPYGSPMNSGQPGAGAAGYVSPGMVGQIKAVSICMIILGAIEIVVGIFFVVLAFVMPQFFAMQTQQTGGPAMDEAQLLMMQRTFAIFYGGGGAAGLVAGFLRLVAGILTFRFKGRRLAIASHFIGLSTCALCYCIPTSIGMCVWGCIVHFNASVVHRFNANVQG